MVIPACGITPPLWRWLCCVPSQQLGDRHVPNANPLVVRAWRRQTISMPPYEESLSAEDLDHLWAWVSAVRENYAE